MLIDGCIDAPSSRPLHPLQSFGELASLLGAYRLDDVPLVQLEHPELFLGFCAYVSLVLCNQLPFFEQLHLFGDLDLLLFRPVILFSFFHVFKDEVLVRCIGIASFSRHDPLLDSLEARLCLLFALIERQAVISVIEVRLFEAEGHG